MCSSLFDEDQRTENKIQQKKLFLHPRGTRGQRAKPGWAKVGDQKAYKQSFCSSLWKTQRPEVCDTEIGAPLTLRRYSRAPLPAPAPDTGPSLRGSCTPFAGVPHLPRALMRAVARGRAGVCLSSALRARVHANPPGKPPRPVRPVPARLRAPRKMSARPPRRAQRSPVRRYRRERWAGRAESAGRRSRTY